ncbi:MAG: sugar transferase [Candidatus Omnitrophica bacterium]|nr:sugar transferase [Candidatus Omnitrophota bacterium]
MRKELTKANALYIVFDIVLIAICVYVPYILRYNRLTIEQLINLPIFWKTLHFSNLPTYSLIFVFWTLLIILILNNYGLYGTDRELSIPREIILVLRAIFFASLPPLAAIFFLKVMIFSRLIFGISAVTIFICLSLWRIIKRLYVRQLILEGYNNLNVLIVGAGKTGAMLVDEIKNHPFLGLNIVGFLDDYRNKTDVINGYHILGETTDFEKIVKKKFIDEVYITIPSQKQKVVEVTSEAKRLGVTVRMVPELFDLSISTIEMHHIGSVPLLQYHIKEIHGTDLIIKRALDLCLSGLALLLCCPLFLILSVLIKLDSPGPIWYISKRCGRKGRLFNFYKFRSMVQNADTMLGSLKDKNEKKGPIFKMADDPRVTKLGRLMRKLSLDELPQLWNVFKGDMSLVGPRPPTPEEVEQYKDWQLKRLQIKPGITCLWQIRGRSNLSFYKWVKLDLWYINNWSFGLDLKILWLTIPVVLKRKGAY